jgi:hypothetical protein
MKFKKSFIEGMYRSQALVVSLHIVWIRKKVQFRTPDLMEIQRVLAVFKYVNENRGDCHIKYTFICFTRKRTDLKSIVRFCHMKKVTARNIWNAMCMK